MAVASGCGTPRERQRGRDGIGIAGRSAGLEPYACLVQVHVYRTVRELYPIAVAPGNFASSCSIDQPVPDRVSRFGGPTRNTQADEIPNAPTSTRNGRQLSRVVLTLERRCGFAR